MVVHLFRKTPLPKKISSSLQATITKISKLKTQDQALKEVHKDITKNFKGCHAWNEIGQYMSTDLSGLWQRKGGSHCTNLNFLVRTILIKSGHFEEKEISIMPTFIIVTPHQFLRVKLKNRKKIDLDPWGWTKGIPLGEYAHCFYYHGPKSI